MRTHWGRQLLPTVLSRLSSALLHLRARTRPTPLSSAYADLVSSPTTGSSIDPNEAEGIGPPVCLNTAVGSPAPTREKRAQRQVESPASESQWLKAHLQEYAQVERTHGIKRCLLYVILGVIRIRDLAFLTWVSMAITAMG
jgi:hypothetical protein